MEFFIPSMGRPIEMPLVPEAQREEEATVGTDIQGTQNKTRKQ